MRKNKFNINQLDIQLSDKSNWSIKPQERRPSTPTSSTPSSPKLLHSPILGTTATTSFGQRRNGSIRRKTNSNTAAGTGSPLMRKSVSFNNSIENHNFFEYHNEHQQQHQQPQQQQQQQLHLPQFVSSYVSDSSINNSIYSSSSIINTGNTTTSTNYIRKRKKMADSEKEETTNLVEFEWVLHEEVQLVLKNLHKILVECAHRFPVPLYGNEGRKIDKFSLTVPQDNLKCIVTLTGDSITHADISFKVQRIQNQIQRTSINPDSPWKLQQVQDAANHLQQAIHHIDNVDFNYYFKTSDEVLHVLGNILAALQRGRTSLVIPKKKPIDELMKSRNMKSLSPNLPDDQAISFYLQSHKLIFAVYQLTNVQGTMKFDSCQAEYSVPWLNEVLVLLTVALQLCQQLKDKISVFSQYKDFTVGSRSPSAMSY